MNTPHMHHKARSVLWKQPARKILPRTQSNVQAVLFPDKDQHEVCLFEQVVDGVANLSGSDFYIQWNTWKALVDKQLRSKNASPPDATKVPSNYSSDDTMQESGHKRSGMKDTSDVESDIHMRSSDAKHGNSNLYSKSDTDESNVSTTFGTAEFFNFVVVMHGLERKSDPARYDETPSLMSSDSLSQIFHSELDLSKVSQAMLASEDVTAKSSAAPPPEEGAVNTANVSSNERREADGLRISSRSEGPTAAGIANNYDQENTAAARHHSLPSNFVPKLPIVVQCAQVTPQLKQVKEMPDKYPVILTDAFMKSHTAKATQEDVRLSAHEFNYVVPLELTTKLKSVVLEESKKRQPSRCINPIRRCNQRAA